MKKSLLSLTLFLPLLSIANEISIDYSTKSLPYHDTGDIVVTYYDIFSSYREASYSLDIETNFDRDILCKILSRDNNSSYRQNLDYNDIFYRYNASEYGVIMNNGNLSIEKRAHRTHSVQDITCLSTGDIPPLPTPIPPTATPDAVKDVCSIIGDHFNILGKECSAYSKNKEFNSRILNYCKEMATNYAQLGLKCIKSISDIKYSFKELEKIDFCMKEATGFNLKKMKCLKKQ